MRLTDVIRTIPTLMLAMAIVLLGPGNRPRRMILTGDTPSPADCHFHARGPFVIDLRQTREPAWKRLPTVICQLATGSIRFPISPPPGKALPRHDRLPYLGKPAENVSQWR